MLHSVTGGGEVVVSDAKNFYETIKWQDQTTSFPEFPWGLLHNDPGAVASLALASCDLLLDFLRAAAGIQHYKTCLLAGKSRIVAQSHDSRTGM